MRVAVVGGGIAGMAAAYEAALRGAEVTLYEASSALGGKLRTSPFAGVLVDEGPDAFLARVPHAVGLCRELGLGDELVAPASGQAYVWTRGGLWPLPEGLVLGVPTGLVPLARSPLLSWRGAARAGLDVVLPRSRWSSDDPSVEEVISARFGREVSERLVEPLIGGIHAGRADGLSLASAAPQLGAAVGRSRSLLLGLRGTAPSLGRSRHRLFRGPERSVPRTAEGGPSGPVFYALRGGMGRLVSALSERLASLGVAVELGQPVDALPDADRVVVALPARAAAGLLGSVSAAAAGELRGIEHASVVLVTMAFPAAAFGVGGVPAGSGFLVPRVDGRLMTACSFGSNKWPHWRGSDGSVVLRVSAGRAGDDRAMSMSDESVVAALVAELGEAVGLSGEPTEVRISRWPDGFPQYAPGHAARVERIKSALAQDAPHVRIAGAALDGVGIPACIASARAAAST